MTAKIHPQIRDAFNAGVLASPGAQCPHIWSSDCFEAWEAGRALASQGHDVESLVKKSRATFTARLSSGREVSATVRYVGKGSHQIALS